MGPLHVHVSADQKFRGNIMNITEVFYFIKWLLAKYTFCFWHLSTLLLMTSWIIMSTAEIQISVIAFECSLYLISATFGWYSLKALGSPCWNAYQKEKQATFDILKKSFGEDK